MMHKMNPLTCLPLSLVAIVALALYVQRTQAVKLTLFQTTATGLRDRGHSFELELEGSVSELKDKLSKAYEVPTDAFHVFWSGHEQKDDCKLDNSIPNLANELRLECDFHLVDVVLPDGKSTPFVGFRHETISILKDRIARKLNLPRELLILRRPDGVAVGDSETTEAYVGTSGHNHDLNLAYTSGQLRVKLPSGELVRFGFEPNERVANLKKKIQEEKGIAQDRQSLSIKGIGELEDDALLILAGLSAGSILTLVERVSGEPNIVYVRMESRRLLTFEVGPHDTVASLKVKINRAEEIPLANQHLFVSRFLEMADNRQLSDYFTRAETIVNLILCPNGDGQNAGAQNHVHVYLLGDEIKETFLGIKFDDTVGSVKSRLRSKFNLPQDYAMHLYSRDQELEDNKPMLEHVINNGSFLDLIVRSKDGPEVIHVNLPSGRVVTINMALSGKVIELKNYIAKAYEKFPLEKQRIFFKDQELFNNFSLNEYQLTSGSTVGLILRH